MIDIIIIQINGLILVAKPIKNETTELVLPIISERGIRLEYFHRSDSSRDVSMIYHSSCDQPINPPKDTMQAKKKDSLSIFSLRDFNKRLCINYFATVTVYGDRNPSLKRPSCFNHLIHFSIKFLKVSIAYCLIFHNCGKRCQT